MSKGSWGHRCWGPEIKEMASWALGSATSVLLLVHHVPSASPGKHRPTVELCTGLHTVPRGPEGCPLSHTDLLSSHVLDWLLMLVVGGPGPLGGADRSTAWPWRVGGT